MKSLIKRRDELEAKGRAEAAERQKQHQKLVEQTNDLFEMLQAQCGEFAQGLVISLATDKQVQIATSKRSQMKITSVAPSKYGFEFDGPAASELGWYDLALSKEQDVMLDTVIEFCTNW
ncbi:hypothetical protein [Beijerinckia sp. L45]|uniref:hypothetical protein n=1 Tax=Beijerinckia sp. L45 TaxID=1641855 RepID=UPI00131D6517|nr:hypothetical protein [Beijerinckia sp. L45]